MVKHSPQILASKERATTPLPSLLACDILASTSFKPPASYATSSLLTVSFFLVLLCYQQRVFHCFFFQQFLDLVCLKASLFCVHGSGMLWTQNVSTFVEINRLRIHSSICRGRERINLSICVPKILSDIIIITVLWLIVYVRI